MIERPVNAVVPPTLPDVELRATVPVPALMVSSAAPLILVGIVIF